SIKSKIAVITAASIGMVLTQSSSPRAETENSGGREKAKIAAPIDVDEDVLYSALPDEALERAAASSTGSQYCTAHGMYTCGGYSPQRVKKPPSGGLKTGPTTVAPKAPQGNKNK